MLEKGLSSAVEAEYWQLQAAVSRMEALMNGAAKFDPTTSAMLERFVSNAKNRIANIEVESHEKAEQEKATSERQAAIAAAVQRETNLSAQEKAEYQSFLSEDYFTKSDFSKLEQFYSNPWDRLTEGGKDQMSYRLWEGVRRNEYEFSELPDIVKEKEASRLNAKFRDSEKLDTGLEKIPESDRNAFSSAWEHGHRAKAYEILDHSVFAQNVATSTKTVLSEAVVTNDKAAAAIKQVASSETAKTISKGCAAGDVDLGLNDLQLLEDPSDKISTPLPYSKNSDVSRKK